MRFVDPALQSGLEVWRQTKDDKERAAADNLWFEERVSSSRQVLFEKLVRSADVPSALPARHTWYWERYIRSDDPMLLPHTFQTDLEPARLGPHPLEPFQPIVRLEELSTPLGAQGLVFEKLQTALSENHTAVVDKFLEEWNAKRDYRPAFAAWKDQVLDELAAPDWPDRMRDRLGLAHHNPIDGPIPVALMQYAVRDVTIGAAWLDCPHAFTAPTVLDDRPSPYFFPAPKELPYGRAMSLSPLDDNDQLLAQMLHFRLTYRRDHIVKLGEIRRRIGEFSKELRNHHLVALQLASNRYDFGEEMP